MARLDRLRTAPGAYLELASELGEEKELVACRPEGGAGFRAQRLLCEAPGSTWAARERERPAKQRSSHLGAALKAELGQEEVRDVEAA